MKASMKSPDGKGTTTADVIAKEPGELTIPIRDLEGTGEVIVLGLRQEMLTVGDGSVDTGTGLGTDFIRLRWGDRNALVRGSELLKAWVATFSPEDAAKFPDEIR
jgi:hypothetical protein